MPPLGAFPILLICLPALGWMIQSCTTKRQAFFVGWSYGAGFFIASLYWISIALFIDIQAWWWVLPFSAIAGPGLLGIFTGLGVLLAWRIGLNKTLNQKALALVACLALMEWMRGHVLTGFPWNLSGHAFSHVLPIMQSVSVIGIYGLGFLTLLWAAAPLFTRAIQWGLLALFIGVFLAGTVRLQTPASIGEKAFGVRIVQANIPQTMKWDWDLMRENILRHMNLTALPADIDLHAVVWPETAVAFDLERHATLAKEISQSLPAGSTGLIGTLRRSSEQDFHNSLIALDEHGRVVAHYDKFHLVPFGEYMPFREYLNLTPIGLAVSNMGDFTPGAGVMTLNVNDLPSFSPLICYEIIFPKQVARAGNDRPRWIVNVTNDGWYGQSAGPYQHFAIARFRAIEEGLPLVRAANTGISGVIDAYGRIVKHLELGRTGVVDTVLPEALPPTIYSRYKDAFFWLVLSGAFSGMLIRSRKVHLQN